MKCGLLNNEDYKHYIGEINLRNTREIANRIVNASPSAHSYKPEQFAGLCSSSGASNFHSLSRFQVGSASDKVYGFTMKLVCHKFLPYKERISVSCGWSGMEFWLVADVSVAWFYPWGTSVALWDHDSNFLKRSLQLFVTQIQEEDIATPFS